MLLLAAVFTFPPPSLAGGYCPEEVQRAALVREKIDREWPLRPNDEVVRYVRYFAQNLAAHGGNKAPWHLDVVRDYSANAYSIGSGFIYITEGSLVLADGESELAAMLAHEMGHDQLGHFCVRNPRKGWLDGLFGWMLPDSPRENVVPGASKGSLSQGWDPEKEREANAWARRLLASAGYDPGAVDRVAWKIENRLHEGSSPGSAVRPFDPAQGRAKSPPGFPRNGDSDLLRIQKLLSDQRP